MRRLVLVTAAVVVAACHSAGPTSVPTTQEPPHITTFSWRNNTATLACVNLLTGEDIAAILCSADAEAAVRITLTDVGGDCSPSPLPHGSRCKTILGVGSVEGSWEAPWDRGATDTAMTVTATCEVLDARGRVADTRTTCISSVGFAPPQQYFQPPWPASCEALLLGCHTAP
jgi:hypothetical protein